MTTDSMRKKIFDYVEERRCREGRFCFYKLEEPNGSDTYYALSILDWLGVPQEDPRTVNYLQEMQHSDGSYDSVFAAFYSLKGLRLLNADPLADPLPYILKHIRRDRIHTDQLPAEILSIFKRMAFLVELYSMFRKEADPVLEDPMIRLILSFRNANGGFGYLQSTLSETAKALVMLKALSYPLENLEVDRFLRECEVPRYGFTEIPGTSLFFLEFIYGGLLAASAVGYQPRYIDSCIDFIKNCRTRRGGFSRAMHGGIATLENTFYAVHALKLLSVL
jgi:hypothetical protein